MVRMVVDSEGWKPAEAASDESVLMEPVNGTITLVLMSVNSGTDVVEDVEVGDTVSLALGPRIPGGTAAVAWEVSCAVALVAVVLEFLGSLEVVLLAEAVMPV
jgi:hypothetical protein